MKFKEIALVYAPPNTRESDKTLQCVKDILKKLKIKYHIANREILTREKFHNKDLVIAVGGDGTFLRACQHIDSHLIFGVNADTKNKEGFFMHCDKKNFEAKLKKIISGDFKIKSIPRLEAFVNGKKIKFLAVNEFYVGQKKAYHASKYQISIGKRVETHKSSGVLIVTPAGSHAWSHAIVHRSLPLNSDSFMFVVREPYEGKVFRNYKLKSGILKSNQQIIIHSEMLDGALVADSVSYECSLKHGSRITVRLSKKPLNMIW